MSLAPNQSTEWVADQEYLLSWSLLEEPDLSRPSALATVEMHVSGVPYVPTPVDGADHSFIRQFRDLSDKCALAPETAFFVTANSAIPVADAIRGLFAGLGIQDPIISHIEADEYTADIAELRTVEVARLHDLSLHAPHVVILDQDRHTGKTITRAAQLAADATGFPDEPHAQLLAVNGRWYPELIPRATRERLVVDQYDYIDYDATSVPQLAAAMRWAGGQAAKGLLGQKYSKFID